MALCSNGRLVCLLLIFIVIVQWQVTWQVMSTRQRALPRSLTVIKNSTLRLLRQERYQQANKQDNQHSQTQFSLPQVSPTCSPPTQLPFQSSSFRYIRHIFESIFGSKAFAPIGDISPDDLLPLPISLNSSVTRLRAKSSLIDIMEAELRIDSIQTYSIPPLSLMKLAPSLTSPISNQSEAIHAFLITQDYFTFTCEFLQSAILHGVVPHVIAFGGPGPGRGMLGRGVIFNWGLGKPILSLRAPIEALVKRLGGEILVLITDAHDTLLTTSSSVLELKFRSFQLRFPLARIVIAAERSCFPITQAECDRFPQTEPLGLPYRNLNSGTWMGKGSDVLNVLDAIELTYPNGLSNYTMNDQAALQYLYLDTFARKLLGLQLDYSNELFMCLHMSQDDIISHPNVSFRKCNKLSGACPAILHFNGGSKELQKPIDAEISSSLAIRNSESLRKGLGDYILPELDLSFRSFCCDTRWTDQNVGNKIPISSMRCGRNESNWAK